MRYLLAGVLAALGFAAPASANLLLINGEAPSRPYERWARASKVPPPPGPIALTLRNGNAHAAGFIASTTPGTHAIEVEEQGRMDRDTLLHELGHQFDYWVMTDYYRSEFRKTMTAGRSLPWRSGTFLSPNEQFANAYALCGQWYGIGPMTPALYSNGWEPSPRQHRRACQIIRFAAVSARLRARAPAGTAG